RIGPFWHPNIGQVYQLLHELERRGLVVRRDEGAGSRARRIFRLTPRGERALGTWLTRRPAWPAPLRDEILVRLLAAERGGHAAVLAQLGRQQWRVGVQEPELLPALRRRREERRIEVGCELGRHVVDLDRHHADALRRHLRAQRTRERVDRRLGGRVGGEVRPGLVRRGRGDVHDVARAARQHVAERR